MNKFRARNKGNCEPSRVEYWFNVRTDVTQKIKAVVTFSTPNSKEGNKYIARELHFGSKMTSLIRRKNNAVFSTANNKKEAKTGHFWMHLLATNDEFKKLSALLLLGILLLRFLLHCNTASISVLTI